MPMNQPLRNTLTAALVALVGFAAAGCKTTPKAKPLTPAAFTSPRNTAPPATAPATAGATSANYVPRPGDNSTAAVRPVDPPNRTILNPPATNPAAAGTTPSTLPAIGATSGQYLSLGGVVAEVNGAPIYANKVISMLERDGVLQTKARQLDAATFQRSITDDIRRQVQELVSNELEYAAAQRSLDAEDRKMADAYTIYWRQQQITKSGGSVELARRNSMETQGIDFDELVQEHSRQELVRIYYQKRVHPRIQVTAADVREYYDNNVTREFTENEKVKFRLLKVDIAKTGSKEAAITKIAEKYKRAKGGEDFAEMVVRENDEKMFATDKAWEMAPASFSIAKVRDALVKLQPGQISEIIEDGSAFYLVKLDERKGGRVRPFEEQKVQEEIRTRLRTEQFRKLRDMERGKLMKGAIIRTDDNMVLPAIQMAMQKYRLYAAK